MAIFYKSFCEGGSLHFSLAPNARQPDDRLFQIVVKVETCIDLIVFPLEIGIDLRIIKIDCQEGIQRVTESGFISLLLYLVNKLIGLLDEYLADFILGRCWLCSFCILSSSFLHILKVFSGMF